MKKKGTCSGAFFLLSDVVIRIVCQPFLPAFFASEKKMMHTKLAGVVRCSFKKNQSL